MTDKVKYFLLPNNSFYLFVLLCIPLFSNPGDSQDIGHLERLKEWR